MLSRGPKAEAMSKECPLRNGTTFGSHHYFQFKNIHSNNEVGQRQTIVERYRPEQARVAMGVSDHLAAHPARASIKRHRSPSDEVATDFCWPKVLEGLHQRTKALTVHSCSIRQIPTLAMRNRSVSAPH
jgi:hypothetical protein